VVPAQQYFAFRLGASDLYLVSYAAIFLVVILLLPRGVVPSLGEWIRGRQARASVASATAPDPQQPAPAGAAR
jgi:branched-chain amino acid transport system permease protein